MQTQWLQACHVNCVPHMYHESSGALQSMALDERSKMFEYFWVHNWQKSIMILKTYGGKFKAPSWDNSSTSTYYECAKGLNNQVSACPNGNTTSQSCVLDVFLIMENKSILWLCKRSYLIINQLWRNQLMPKAIIHHDKLVLFMCCCRHRKGCQNTGTKREICVENSSVLRLPRCGCCRIEAGPEHPQKHSSH